MERNTARVNFQRINQAALNAYPDLLRHLLPGGRVQGHEFVAGDLAGSVGRSLSVNLLKGCWKDFSTGAGGSDPVSLWAAAHKCPQGEAARMLAAELGLQDEAHGAQALRTQPAPAKQAQVKRSLATADKVPEKIVHPQHGQPAATWTYRDAQSKVLGVVCRWNPPGGRKIVMPFTPFEGADGKTRWQWKSWPQPRPLYGLDRLAAHPDAPVIIPEGEKSADAAQELFSSMVATTWPHGADSTENADYTPLKDRVVYVSPDADAPGHKAAQAVCAAAVAAGAKAVFFVTPPEGKAKGWHLADAVAEGWAKKKAADWLQANSLRYAQEAEAAPPTLDIKPLDIGWCLRTPPPPKVFHVYPYIPAGTVGVLTGTGAVGKSFLLLELSVALACGRSFGPFKIEEAKAVLILNVEDDQDDFHRRLAAISDAFRSSYEEQQLLKKT